MTDSLIEKTNKFYDLILTDPEKAIGEFVAPDIVWENPMPPIIPFGGTYNGVEGLIAYLTKIAAALELSPLHFTDVIGQGNIVSAIGAEQDTKVIPTGKTYNMPFVHVVRFNDDGKINHVREYNDTTEMLAAFQY